MAVTKKWRRLYMAQSYDKTLETDGPKDPLKQKVCVELILQDGTHLNGRVYIPKTIEFHNLFVALPDFFHLHRDTTDYYLINKAYVAVCKIPTEDK